MATIIVMKASPFDSTIVSTMAAPEAPAGLIDDVTPFEVTFYGNTTDVFVSWGGREGGYTTAAADTPASTYIPAKMTQPFGYQFQLFGDVDLTQPGSFSGGGQLVISDPDGSLDGWLAYAWDGRDITLYRGSDTAAFSTFTVVARLTCDGWGEITRLKKTLKIRDLGWKFAVPIPMSRYAGTGGAEGSSDIQGRTRPVVIHSVFFCTAVLLDATSLVYQYHDPRFEPLTIYDGPSVSVGGVTYTMSATYPSYALLASATITPGTFAWCMEEGMIRLGSALPQGQELRLPTAFGLAGFQTPLPADIITAMIEKIGRTIPGMPSDITADVSIGSGDPEVQLLIPMSEAAPSLGDILNAVTYGGGWYWWPSLTGSTIYVRAIVDPSGESATVTIDASKAYTVAVDPVVTPTIPQSEQSILYARRGAAQSRASLAGSVSESQAQNLSREALVVNISDAVNSGVAHRSSRVVIRNSPFATSSQARQRARELSNVFKTQRYIVTLRVGEMDPLDPPIGEIVDLQNFNRLGFGSSKKFLCIGCRANLAHNTLELTLWG